MGTFRTSLKSWASRLVSAVVVVFLLFSPYCANVLVPRTRYFSMWQQRDTLLLLGSMVSLALVCVAASGLVRLLKRPLLTRIFNHLFVVAMGAGLLANLWFHTHRAEGYHIGQRGMEIKTLWLLLAVLVGYSLARPELRLVQRCRALGYIVSPAVLVVVFQMLSGRTYPPGLDSLPEPVAASVVRAGQPGGDAHPVYLFVLDAWSYDRTYEDDGSLRPIFPNLAELSQQSIVFHDADSPGPNTEVSIPRLLFRTNLPVVWGEGRCSFKRDGRLVPSLRLTSIFSPLADKGYHTFALGFCVSYRELLGDQVEVYRSYPWLSRYRGQDALIEMGAQVFEAMRYWTDPWSSFLYRKLGRRMDDARALRAFSDMQGDVLNIITAQPRNTLGFFHYPCPHSPYLLNEDGSYRGPGGEGAWDWSNAEGYERNLANADRLIGRFVGAMKDAGRFDDALVIFTSDHAWPEDPEWKAGWRTEPRTHVPLIVKMPGQKHPLTVTSRFETRTIGSLIECALQAEVQDRNVRQLLQEVMAESEPFSGVRRLAWK